MNVLEICRQKLQEGGLRLTRQREQILTIMYEHQGEHLTREGISNLVQREYPSVGKATVYRTITVFEKLGIVSRNNLDERVRYELADPEQVHEHHHMICLACGRIAEMQGDFLETQEQILLKDYGFHVVNHQLKFYGYCRDCAKEREL
jgi:Fur family ferric uptake transcriptional regulator